MRLSSHVSHSATDRSADTQTHVRRFHRTAQEELLDAEMKRTIRDSSALNMDLQSVSNINKVVLQQTQANRIEQKHLEQQLVEDEKKVQTESKIQAEKASLAAELNKLSLALEQQRRETARQQSISAAASQKVNMLEHSMRVMSKAWKDAAQHQASIVKALRIKEVDAQLAAGAKAKVAKARVTKAVAHAHKSHMVPKVPWFAAAAREAAQDSDAEEEEDEEDEEDADKDDEISGDDDTEDDDDTI